MTITVTTVSESTIRSRALYPEGSGDLILVGGRALSISAIDNNGQNVLFFLKPFTVTFTYTTAQRVGLDESSLKLFLLSGGIIWKLTNSNLNPNSLSVSASVFEVGIIGLFGKSTVYIPSIADLNKDSRVDLTDFSILLFNWGLPKNNAADFNQDGVVDLVDFSIMLFWWTG